MELIAIFQSVWTIVVMVLFLGIVAWAYSSKRKSEFDEAAQQPMKDDDDSSENTDKDSSRDSSDDKDKNSVNDTKE